MANEGPRVRKTRTLIASLLPWVLSALPALGVACLYGLALRATALLGHWPVPMVNDPKIIGHEDPLYRFLYDSLPWLMGAALVSIPFWTLALIWQHLRHQRPRTWPHVGGYGAGWLLWAIVFGFDPGGIVGWMID